MALTQEQFNQLKIHWGACIQAIYPSIAEIVDGGGDTIASKLSTWRSTRFEKPTEAAVEDALLNTVLPAVQAAEQAQETAATNQADIRSRLAASALNTMTPAQIYNAMQGQIDNWSSLADAKADLREWLPLMASAIVWLANHDNR